MGSGLSSKEKRERFIVSAKGVENILATGVHAKTSGSWGLFEAIGGNVTFGASSVHVVTGSDAFREDEALYEDTQKQMYLTTVHIKTLEDAGTFLRATIVE